jgi:site-specific DNA-methyltransferase (adenine-specific)
MRDLIDLRCGPWETALADVEMVDAVIVDAPYSAKVHAGHDSITVKGRGGSQDDCERRAINYGGWSAEDVQAFVDDWSPRCRGWFVTITDHILAPAWAAAMGSHGRYVFAPLPWVAPGSRVRMAGDGPSCWTCQIVVGRPRAGTYRDGTKAHKWGTLRGAYVVTSERGNGGSHIGGKPSKLMRMLVSDYSRPGDLICDPCAGWATTLLAAAQEGRRAVGSEMDPETYADALKRLDRDTQQSDLFSNIKRIEGNQ